MPFIYFFAFYIYLFSTPLCPIHPSWDVWKQCFLWVSFSAPLQFPVSSQALFVIILLKLIQFLSRLFVQYSFDVSSIQYPVLFHFCNLWSLEIFFEKLLKFVGIWHFDESTVTVNLKSGSMRNAGWWWVFPEQIGHKNNLISG